MGPLLDALRELGGEGRPREVEEIVARTCGVTDQERLVRNKKGALKFANQVAWCRQYLIYENLVNCPERGVWKLTDSGSKTNLSIENAREIVRKWVRHHKEKREQSSEAVVDSISRKQSLFGALDTNDSIAKAAYDLAACARDTSLSEEKLARWLMAIDRKKQAVLYGPPGTGKTFLAERIARHLSDEGPGFSEVLQFHAGYSYEDFVEGIRPRTRADGHVEYAVLPGRFVDFCQRATQSPGLCVLIIDEINRANLSRVFGELLYLLEYRDHEISLACGGRFQIPRNVRVLGTMNTADRSIALVDHALRRRFAFFAVRPDYEILRQFQHKAGFNAEPLIDLLRDINRQIGDRHYEIGISFFLQHDLASQLQDIWSMEIEPYLEEVFFDQSARLDNLRWERVGALVLP
jgi:5-methylcytosine-specific restriction protein B